MDVMRDIYNRWATNHPTPAWVGAAPEGTAPPYVVFAYQSGSEVRGCGRVVMYQEGLVSFLTSALTSTEANDLKKYAYALYNLQAFGSVMDMALTNQTSFYSDVPTLTGNRGWVAQIDFAIKHTGDS